MDLSLVLVFTIVFLVSVLLTRKRWNLPPGYIGLPVVGSISLLRKLRQGKKPHLVFYEESKRLGNVYCWYMGDQLVVILSGYDVVHEALVKKADIFSDRPTFREPIIPKVKGENGGY